MKISLWSGGRRGLGVLCTLLAACSRSGLAGEAGAGRDPASAGGGGAGNAGGGSGNSSAGGEGGVVGPPRCHLALASPAAIPLLAFPEGSTDTPQLVVIDAGDAHDPSGPRPARVASQAISQEANFWHPELRIAGLRIDAPWPKGTTIEKPPALVGIDAHAYGRIAPTGGGGLALLWYRGDEAAGLPTGIKVRAFDTAKWAAGAEVFLDEEGSLVHALRPGKVNGAPGGADGLVASWSAYLAASAFETRVAVLDSSGAIAHGPFAVTVGEYSPGLYVDVIWTGESHLLAVGVTATGCVEGGPPCAPAAMNILRMRPPSGDDPGGLELAASVPVTHSGAEPRRPAFARTGNATWLAWWETDPADEKELWKVRLARLDAAGNVVGTPETVADGVTPTTALSLASTATDLLLAWGEDVNAELMPYTLGHSRIVVLHRDAEGAPASKPITVETTGFVGNPSISMVGIDYPWSVMMSWASAEEGQALVRAITYLSRLDCVDGP